MRFLFYTHSLVSDWNHGNAHFLRGIMRDLIRRGHEAEALEPSDAWSRMNLAAAEGEAAIARFSGDFPELSSRRYDADFDHEAALGDADAVIVHEWIDPAVMARIAAARRAGGRFVLLFHDTHHRAVSERREIAALDLEACDAILAFGAALAEVYRRAGWGRQVHVWHEAADTQLFRPLPGEEPAGDLVWIGNWGDNERTAALEMFLVGPVRALGLCADVHGVRYPRTALERLDRAGIRYRGWIANADVPRAFARHRVTVHVPRAPYVEALPGIPTIRMFEALACGIPLVSAPWSDEEGLFRPGRDFLFAADGEAMTQHLRAVLADVELAQSLARSGLETILRRHTCRHRVDELIGILRGCAPAAVRERLGDEEVAA